MRTLKLKHMKSSATFGNVFREVGKAGGDNADSLQRMRSLWIRSKVSKMADSLTDEQLVGELRRYGETVSLPIKPNKRPILIKKLNHLRSRNKSPQQKGKGKQPAQRRQSNMGAFSSDDSDAELDPTPGPSRSEGSTRRSLEQSTPSKITEVVTRSLRRRPNVGPLSVTVGRGRRPTDAVQAGLLATPGGSTALSSGKWRRRGLDDAPETDEMSPNGSSYRSPRLYPDISAQRVTARDSSFSDRSTIPFESSESDVEGSSYEVANKSVNTSFTLTRGGRSPASNHVSPSRQSFETNHTFYRRGLASHSRLRRRFYPEHVSFGLVALVLAFFVVIFFGYMFVRKELFMGWLFMTTSAEGEAFAKKKKKKKKALSVSLCFSVSVCLSLLSLSLGQLLTCLYACSVSL